VFIQLLQLPQHLRQLHLLFPVQSALTTWLLQVVAVAAVLITVSLVAAVAVVIAVEPQH
jgi:hypothetical protein